jgi:hypothetical protein
MRDSSAKAGKLTATYLLAALVCSSVVATEADNREAAGGSARRDQTSSFDLAKLSAEARVVYISSGQLALARRMIDGNPATKFDFSSSDLHPTVIVELAQNQRLHRVTALYAVEEGQLDVYLLDKLSGGGTDVLKGKPIVSIANPASGNAAVEFDPRGARYVALRWTRKKAGTGSFKVAEVGAFAIGSNSAFSFVEPSSSVQSTIHMTSNGGPDFSNTLGTLAEPPVMASPPAVTPVSP